MLEVDQATLSTDLLEANWAARSTCIQARGKSWLCSRQPATAATPERAQPCFAMKMVKSCKEITKAQKQILVRRLQDKILAQQVLFTTESMLFLHLLLLAYTE